LAGTVGREEKKGEGNESRFSSVPEASFPCERLMTKSLRVLESERGKVP
jgi:hypothetical protein